ncbi:XRE family transcriptional regulator [Providencia rettgeri]|uniref:XRE family transcriptional regulator n=1 Tax=Providencia rettgeri TaxID=587 RepID=UPI0034E0DF77
MNLDEIVSAVKNLSDEEKSSLSYVLTDSFPLPIQQNEYVYLASLQKKELRQLIIQELKKQGITYEEMAMQIGVSIATFKRIISDPLMAKAINLHRLLNELGLKICLEK